MLKILFTGGESGGHIYPLVAVAEEITRQASESGLDIAFDYLGTSGEFGIVLENSGMAVHATAGGKFRNYSSILNYLDFSTELVVPFFKGIHPDLGWFYILVVCLVVTGASAFGTIPRATIRTPCPRPASFSSSRSPRLNAFWI